ncbi:MAG: DUF3489 domain-containing protein [Beijerinckiaceae bacterium]|uniref:DUF3489 domain-containing protein n=1 Tax=Hyphomicrobium sp. TaxID=82 RepID=UPI0025C23A7C|nr:DUF3489 domain-containing protein [Hyphomicrobium sp.]MBX9740499.1 DUF3489 domain-containing protein [Beijerinckiaceae bacterium]MBX9864842.1 DUF3489 domain-containing protein [Hyphomicrobium sp.]
MTNLTDTQLIVLNAAAQRATLIALPLPPNLKGGAAHKVVHPLIEKGLLEEVDADRRLGEPVWRETGDGHGVTLAITRSGLAALGIEADSAPQGTDGGDDAAEASDAAPEAESPPAAATEAPARKARSGTKQAALIDMLRTPDGATIAEIAAASGWQAHTVRGAMAGALKKKLGLDVTSEKVEGRGRVYRLTAP